MAAERDKQANSRICANWAISKISIMRVLFEIILVIFTVFLLVIQEISFVSASQDTVEAPQQLPFCNDEIKETDKNDG